MRLSLPVAGPLCTIAQYSARFLLWRTHNEAAAATKADNAFRAAGKRQLATCIGVAGPNVRYRPQDGVTGLVPSQHDSN
jgi:hypothetical protein